MGDKVYQENDNLNYDEINKYRDMSQEELDSLVEEYEKGRCVNQIK